MYGDPLPNRQVKICQYFYNGDLEANWYAVINSLV